MLSHVLTLNPYRTPEIKRNLLRCSQTPPTIVTARKPTKNCRTIRIGRSAGRTGECRARGAAHLSVDDDRVHSFGVVVNTFLFAGVFSLIVMRRGGERIMHADMLTTCLVRSFLIYFFNVSDSID